MRILTKAAALGWRGTVTCQLGPLWLLSCSLQWLGIYFIRAYGQGLGTAFTGEEDNLEARSRSQEWEKVSESPRYSTEGYAGVYAQLDMHCGSMFQWKNAPYSAMGLCLYRTNLRK